MVAPVFALETHLAQGLKTLVTELEKRLGLRAPLKMFIAGGMATHLYTGARVTTDVDAEFSKRVLLPADLVVATADGTMLYSTASRGGAGRVRWQYRLSTEEFARCIEHCRTTGRRRAGWKRCRR